MKNKHSFLPRVIGILLINLFSFCLMAQRTAIGNLIIEWVGEIPTSVTERLEQYQNMRTADIADWDASGKGLYITTRFTDVVQIHYMSKASAYREHLLFSKSLSRMSDGHGISKKANQDYTLAAISWFLKKYLLGE